MSVFRVIKTKDYTVMSNHHLKNPNLSYKARGIMSTILSLPEDWDYSLAGLAKISKDGVDSVRAGIVELEKAGYIKRFRKKTEKGTFAGNEYVVYENPEPSLEPSLENPIMDKNTPSLENPTLENPTLEKPTLEKPTLEKPTLEKPTLENPTQLNTNILNTNILNTQSINQSNKSDDVRDKIDEIDKYSKTKNIVKININYETLINDNENQTELIDSVVEIITEVLCLKKEYTINKTNVPHSLISSRFMKLKKEHIDYVIMSLASSAGIKNIKAYIITCLFNSITTLDTYWQQRVNYEQGQLNV